MDERIFFFWIELIKKDMNILIYLPSEFFADKNFRAYLFQIYDINMSIDDPKFNIAMFELDELMKLSSITKYKLYMRNNDFEPLLTADVLMDIVKNEEQYLNKIGGMIALITFICNKFSWLLPEILKCKYYLYFCIPQTFRTPELFNIIFDELYNYYKCDDTDIELDQFYFATSCRLDGIKHPTYNICKYYIFKNIVNLYNIPYYIDLSDIIPVILPKLTYTDIRPNIYSYLTIEICDIIIKNSCSNNNTKYKNLIHYIPLRFISEKSAKLRLMTLPVMYRYTDTYDTLKYLIDSTEYIEICTLKGLIFILDKTLHTSEIYYNYKKNICADESLFVNFRDILKHVNFKLLDRKLLYYFIKIYPHILTRDSPDDLLYHPNLQEVLEYRIFKYIHKIHYSHGILLEYIHLYKNISKYPILKLYASNNCNNCNIPFDTFKDIIYSNMSIIHLHMDIIILLLDEYLYDSFLYDDCINLIKYIILYGLDLTLIDKKYHITCTMPIKLLSHDTYIQALHVVKIPDIPNENIQKSNIPDVSTEMSLIESQINKLYGDNLSIENFYDIASKYSDTYLIAQLYTKSELSSYKKWRDILDANPHLKLI